MIIKEKIEMKSLKRERNIIIYVPDDYLTSKKRYPVLFINDGQNDLFGFLDPNVNNYHFFRKSLTRSQKVIIIISTVFIVGVLR